MGPVPGGKNFIGGVAMRQQKGFTLIELLVVIAIIAILASLAIPSYLSYQRKARVSSYAEPIARACVLDVVGYCMENPDTPLSPIVGPGSPLANCRNTSVTTAGGTVNLNSNVSSVTCGSDGSVSITITAQISGISDYQARCSSIPANYSVKCTIVTPT
jgi:type IV pilus assembly protein PilA